jgi:RNA polymerase primary sigma factor
MSKKFINGNDDTLSRYFKDIKKTNLLTPEEEVALAIRIQDGDASAIEELVTANLKFVISIAKEYQYQGTNINDLINDGNEGLIKAAIKFDHTRGFRFISYAVWWVRQSIIHGLNCNSRLIRLPANVINSLNQIKKNIDRYEITHEHGPCIGELADIKLSDLVLNERPTSLSTIINESGDELIEIFNYETYETEKDEESDKLIRKELDKMLADLTNREKDIIILYFGLNELYEPMTLEGIGEKYNLTKERIRQIKEKAIRKLRHNMTDLYNLIYNEKE